MARTLQSQVAIARRHGRRDRDSTTKAPIVDGRRAAPRRRRQGRRQARHPGAGRAAAADGGAGGAGRRRHRHRIGPADRHRRVGRARHRLGAAAARRLVCRPRSGASAPTSSASTSATYGRPPHRLATLAYDAVALAGQLARAEAGRRFLGRGDHQSQRLVRRRRRLPLPARRPHRARAGGDRDPGRPQRRGQPAPDHFRRQTN